MTDLSHKIHICKQTRQQTSEVMADILAENDGLTETDFTKKICDKLLTGKIYSHGWYEPPPFGVSALFAPADNPQRLLFDNLRKEEFWPKDSYRFGQDKIGILYASPIDKSTGIIGDFGLTVYKGKNENIKNHFKKCLKVLENSAEYAAVGMELRDIHDFAQKLLKEEGLNNDRTVTWADKTKTNIGHTVPWSYEDTTPEGLKVIQSGNFEVVKNLISKKRVYLNSQETFKIPENIAFTTEIRAEANDDPTLPNVFFHMIVTFVDGKKEILGNFNPVFEAVGMDFIKSKY